MRSHTKHSRTLRAWLAGAGMVAMLCLLAVFLGCQDSSNETTTGVSSTGTSTGTLSLASIASGVTLTPEQETLMAAALATFNQAMAEERGRMALDKAAVPDGSPTAGVSTPPVHSLLIECASFLSTSQMTSLVGVISASHDSAGGPPRGGRHGGPRAGCQIDSIAATLGLTEEQVTRLKALMPPMGPPPGDSGMGGPPDFPPPDSTRRDPGAMRDSLATILTAEQLAKWEELCGGMRGPRPPDSTDHTQMEAKRSAQRVEFLTKVLALTTDQQAAVQSAIESESTSLSQSRTAARSASVDRASMRTQMTEIHEATTTAIHNVLGTEQAALYDALASLEHHGPPPMGRQF